MAVAGGRLGDFHVVRLCQAGWDRGVHIDEKHCELRFFHLRHHEKKNVNPDLLGEVVAGSHFANDPSHLLQSKTMAEYVGLCVDNHGPRHRVYM